MDGLMEGGKEGGKEGSWARDAEGKGGRRGETSKSNTQMKDELRMLERRVRQNVTVTVT